MSDPVLAVVRVRAPAEIDPHVLGAELTRVICTRPMTAELTLLPSSPGRTKHGLRQHGFVAVLCTSKDRGPAKLAGVAQKALRKALRKKFGSAASAQVRPAGSAAEIAASWCIVRGNPRRF